MFSMEWITESISYTHHGYMQKQTQMTFLRIKTTNKLARLLT